jgi:DNA polymerase-3 subunit beta
VAGQVKVRIAHEELAEAVGWAAHALPDRSPAPVLLGLLLRADGDTLTVSGYGHDVSAGFDAVAEVIEPGTALVSGRLLADIARALPDHPVEVSTDRAELTLSCGPSLFALPVIPPEDYPRLPDIPRAHGTVDAALFAQAVTQVAVAAGRDDTLPMLTGIFLETGPDTLRLVATDRYRLAVRDLPWRPAAPADPDGTGAPDAPGTGSATALIPARSLLALARSAARDEMLTLSASSAESGGLLAFTSGARRATTRLMSSGFIKYRTLFPESYAGSAVVERQPLQAAVKRVCLVAEGPSALRITLTEGAVTIDIGDGGAARSRETLPAAHSGPDIRLTADRGYVLDALTALTTPYAELNYNAPAQPAVFTGRTAPDADHDPAFRYLVMLSNRG